MQQIIEFLENLPDWQKYTAVGVLVLLIGVYFYYGVHKPRTEQLRKLDMRVTELDTKINKGLMMRGKLDEFRKEVYILREKMRVSEEILGNKPAVDRLIATMESLATQCGLKTYKFDPMSERTHQFYGELPINLEIQGNYHDLGTFFEKVANESRILNVTNLNIRSTRGGNKTIAANCVLTAFWFVNR